MTHKAVLLDTSFFLRFLNDSDPLFKNADGFFRYFLQKEITMMISTISIAEYCVGGDVHELPLRNLQIVPFNLEHSPSVKAKNQLLNLKNRLQTSTRKLKTYRHLLTISV